MQVVEIIRKKRDGGVLSPEEIGWFIREYTLGQLPDYQATALLMAIFFRGMDAQETRDLTMAMARSGEELHVRRLVSPIVDKHSTGGVGDKITLAVAPLVAACGVAVGKMTGRGLGHTGGTVDKLESITDLRMELSRSEFEDILQRHGIVLAGQSGDLAPADGKMYALRDLTGTIDSIPLIAASIMSKKLAIGASHLLLDVKVGSGAFMKTLDQARQLARTMVEIGRDADLHTVAAVTAMDQPLGHAIGNALEVAESIAILRGEGPEDVSDLCYHEAAELLMMTHKAVTQEEADRLVQQAIHSGAALQKFAEVIEAQGGDRRQVEQPDRLPAAPVRSMLKCPQTGFIKAIQAEQLGLASMSLGAGRYKKGEPIDHRTGFILQARIGDRVQKGDPLIEIHARSEAEVEIVSRQILACYHWSAEPVQVGPLIYDTIRP